MCKILLFCLSQSNEHYATDETSFRMIYQVFERYFKIKVPMVYFKRKIKLESPHPLMQPCFVCQVILKCKYDHRTKHVPTSFKMKSCCTLYYMMCIICFYFTIVSMTMNMFCIAKIKFNVNVHLNLQNRCSDSGKFCFFNNIAQQESVSQHLFNKNRLGYICTT